MLALLAAAVTPLFFATPAQADDGIIRGGNTLHAGETRYSPNGSVRLVMQTDGNLVLYERRGVNWASGTASTIGVGNAMSMQPDGNLVVYTRYGYPLWDSHTWGHPGAYLAVQDDGNLVIYSAQGAVLWVMGSDCSERAPGPVGPELMTLANNGIWVHVCLAGQLRRMQDAAAAAGINLGGGGWRSTQAQIDLRRAHCGPTHYDIYDKPSRLCNPPTARPGRSMHERGLAVDFTANGSSIRSQNTAAFRWLAANGPAYGFHNLPSEPWHWSTNGN